MLARLKARSDESRNEELVRAISAKSDAAIYVAFAPNADSRRTLKELLPTLQLPGGSTLDDLDRGIESAQLEVDIPNSARLVVRSADAAAAETLAKAARNAAKVLAQRLSNQEAVARFAAQVRPVAEGTTVSLDLSGDRVAELIELTLSPMQQDAKAGAEHEQTQANRNRDAQLRITIRQLSAGSQL